MRRFFVFLLFPAALASALAGGCSGGHNGAAADAGVDSYGVIVGGGDGGTGEGGGEGGTSVETTMRLAHASPDLGALDFCWRLSGAANFVGPVLGGGAPPVVDAAGAPPDAGDDGADGDTDATLGYPDADDGSDSSPGTDASTDASWDAGLADAASTGALVFGTMAPDVLLPTSGTFDIALLPAGRTSCASPWFVGQVTLDAGKRATVVLMGLYADDAGPMQLSIVSFTDAPLDPQTARVRLIHAALGSRSEPGTPALAVHAGETLLTSEVDPKQASDTSTAPAVDSLGYTTLGALPAPTALELATAGDAAAARWTTDAKDLGVSIGTAHTGIIVSLDQGELGVMWCGDASAAEGTAKCLLYPAAQAQ